MSQPQIIDIVFEGEHATGLKFVEAENHHNRNGLKVGTWHQRDDGYWCLAIVVKVCQTCNGFDWVCEKHTTKPWSGVAGDILGCVPDCSGPGMPCGTCEPFKDSPIKAIPE